MSNNDFDIWEGIYDKFPDETSESVWNSEQWVDSLTERSLSDLSEFRKAGTISTQTLVHEYPLAPAAALLAAEADTNIRILDFGGGQGSSFLQLITSLPDPNIVEFHIIESVAVCQRARQVYHEFDNLYFHNEMPHGNDKFDIVHAGSSLHYVADWRTILKEFVSYKPRLLILSGLTAGDIETFVTSQNYYGSKIPVWFWNVNEVISAVESLSYSLIYKSVLASSYLGKIQPLPMENFPPKYRLERKCNLMFASDNSRNK